MMKNIEWDSSLHRKIIDKLKVVIRLRIDSEMIIEIIIYDFVHFSSPPPPHIQMW